jgi:hypothetical protein
MTGSSAPIGMVFSKIEGAGRNFCLPLFYIKGYLLKTLLASSQMVAPKSSTLRLPVKTAWTAGP